MVSPCPACCVFVRYLGLHGVFRVTVTVVMLADRHRNVGAPVVSPAYGGSVMTSFYQYWDSERGRALKHSLLCPLEILQTLILEPLPEFDEREAVVKATSALKD